ncbi:MAG TPA: efflux RND transporter periplasmic adaptor subunit [Bacteroidales bacterium]|nr:efflux RND transporter periplasmic adaptor subunit [Bacteroidales bacterium]HPS18192.1 efflux RND transporter periplasmic adaptor subunit [Bacteroidales bacterium]
MKKILLIAIAGLFIISCSTDKKSKLEKLKKQYQEIAEQIKNLENEIAKEEGTGTGKDKITEVVITDLKKDEFNHYLEVQGKIDGDENIAVSPKNVGVVTAINVKEGDIVTKGQVLAQLDDAVLKQSLATLDSSLTFVTNIYNKQKRLWDQKIGSEVQYLTAKNNKETVENSIKTLKEQIAMSKIVSPINGTIEEIPIKVGQMVTPGYTTAFQVVNLSKVKVSADVAEAYASKLKSGNEVIVKFPDLNKEVTSKISFSSKFIDVVNRTFTVEVKLDNSDETYRANMIAIIKINDYHVDSAFSIPVNVIQKVEDENYVYIAVKESDKYVAKKVKIKIGQNYNGYTEVLDGLKEGDKLITSGYQNLDDGQTLKF